MADSDDSIQLVRLAKTGDKAAWDALCVRYYPRWIAKLHGKLGRDLVQHFDTEDIVHSALREAVKGIDNLENEGAFFSWVSAIARRKIAEKRRLIDRDAFNRLVDRAQPSQPPDSLDQLSSDEEYLQLLDDILASFPVHPEALAAIYLRYFAALDVAGMEAALGCSESTVHRLVRQGLEILRARRDARTRP